MRETLHASCKTIHAPYFPSSRSDGGFGRNGTPTFPSTSSSGNPKFAVPTFGLGFRIQGFGFQNFSVRKTLSSGNPKFAVPTFGFRVSGSGFRVWDSRISGLGKRCRPGTRSSRCPPLVFGLRVQNPGFQISGSGVRVSELGLQV